jgi:hypothetical protein
MVARVAMPAVRQKRSKLAPTSCQASSTIAAGTTAADVVNSCTALLSFVDSAPPSLQAQGGQRLPSYFNIDRDIPKTGDGNGYAYSFTATIASPDQYINTVYNSYTVVTDHFGIVPLVELARGIWTVG